MAAIYLKKHPNYMNITASVRDEVAYRLRKYSNFTAAEVADAINNTRKPTCKSDPVTVKDVQRRLTPDLALKRSGAYYHR